MTEIENLTANLPATNAFTTPIKDQLQMAIHKFRTNTSQFNLSITEPDIAESANQIAKDFLTVQTISIAGTVNTIKQLITQIDTLRKIIYAELKALNSSVVVEKEEYDEVVAIKPMFLVMDYK